MDIYFFNVTVLRNKEVFQNQLEKVDKTRKEKIKRLKIVDDKLRSLGAGLLMNFIKQKYQVQEKLKIDRFGKPYFDNSSIHFNISHSGSYVIAAVSKEEVGVDIQKIKPDKHRIAEKNFLASECTYINETDENRMKWQRFCEVWTVKEAYLKKIGIGLRKPLNSFEVDWSGERIQIIGEENLVITQFKLDKNYIVSACVDRPDDYMKIEEVKIHSFEGVNIQ